MNDKLALVQAKAAIHEMTQFFTHFLTDDTPGYSDLIFENEGNNTDDCNNSYPDERTDPGNMTVPKDCSHTKGPFTYGNKRNMEY